MAEYKPSIPFSTPMFLFIPTHISAKGSTKKVYPETGELIYCSFKTYGGTEKTEDSASAEDEDADAADSAEDSADADSAEDSAE